MSPLVANLEEFDGSEIGQIGGKAASLAELMRQGYLVPKSLCVTTDAFDREIGLVQFAEARSHDEHQEIVAWLDSRPAQGPLWQELKEAVDFFRGGPMAVRSSATAEDGAAYSLAGQFESFLHVKDWDELVRAIRRCWASLCNGGVAEYCRLAGINPDRLKMAILIQEMVPADAAGALFTVNPLTGDEHQAVLEIAAGTAEKLMAGRVNPERHMLDLRGENSIKGHLMPESAIRDLLELGRKIHLHRGAPQDIEWAYSAGKVYLLQARPVTKIHCDPAIGQWTTADMRDGGVSSYPVTPMMGSLYNCAFDRALNDYLKALGLLKRGQRVEAIRAFFGRLYWNLGAVKARAMRLPGFVEREFDCDLGIDGQYEGDGIRTPATFLSVLKALPLVLRMLREFRRQEKLARRCIRTFSDCEKHYRIDLRSISDSELLQRYRQLITSDFVKTEARYFRTLFNASVSKAEFKRILRKVDPEGKQLSYAGLISGLPPMDHFEPGIALWQSAKKITADPLLKKHFLQQREKAGAAISSEVDSFVRRFYYHSRRELDLTVPRWEEDPDYVRQLLKDYVERVNSVPEPSIRMAEQKLRYEAERNKAGDLCPRSYRRAFMRRLERLRHFIWLREQMRDCSTRMYYWVRKHCVEIARRAVKRGRIECEGDVFYLRWGEVPLLLSSDGEVKSTVIQRREEQALFKNFTAPTEIGSQPHLEPARSAVRAPGRSWQGIGASSGVAVGPCRVIKTLDEAKDLQRGDILVCSYTDPAWTPVLAGVNAVIAETGGLLSHAAVICRELGIPAALNLPGATEFLVNGMQVRVDGFAGLVERVEAT